MGQRYTCDANYRRDMIGLAAFAIAMVVLGLLLKKNYHFGLVTDSCIFAIGALGLVMLRNRRQEGKPEA